MISMLGSATQGAERGEATAATAAADLSRISEPRPADPDVASDLVTLSLGSSQVAVSSKVAETAQQDDKALLDMFA
jgi:hypothetical protein